MASPKGGYYVAGARVPSVTTITGRFKDSAGLVHWAWKLGTEGKDYRSVRDAAANAGTLAHSMIDAHIHGVGVTVSGDEDTLAKARGAFESYLEWQRNSDFNIQWTERQLVSEKHKFGGTPDAFGTINNKPVLIDWKSSNAVYPDHLLQLAAYGELIREVHGVEVQGYYLCRFAKEQGDFSVHHYPELKEELRLFLMLREAYEIYKSVSKRAA